MYLDVYNTHMELYPYVKDQYPIIEDMYTAKDKFSGAEYPCGYMIEESKLYLPRGTSISKIESLCGCKANYITESDPVKKMSHKFSSLYDPKDKLQEDSIKFLKGDEHQLALNLSMGRGKAQPYNTKIPTPSGYTTMGRLKVGDRIFGSDGNVITVDEIYERGLKDVYKITFDDGRYALCGLDHLWNVFKKKGKKYTDEQITVSTEQMLSDYVSEQYMIPTLSGPVMYDYRATLCDPYIYGTLRHKKFIDKSYLYNSCHNRIRLLRGIIDGYHENMSNLIITFESKFPQFILDMRELLIGLGYTIKKYNDHLIRFYTSKKVDKLCITRIEKLNEQQQSRCIKVSAEDELYVTEDFIVTHNTYCTAYASTELGVKTMIITPNLSIKKQWINTYSKMFDYRSSNLIDIAGSGVIDALMLDLIPEADVYFVNHQTLRSYITQHNGYELHDFLKKLGIGIRVYDESHMEFANILLLDNYSNSERTWYLTATFDRSDKTESACFKKAFNSVITFGETESAESARKHVVYHVININSHISLKNRGWLMSRYQGFTAANYGKYAFNMDPNDTMYQTILDTLKKLEKVEGKILIFVPLIDNVDLVVKKLKTDWSIKSIGGYHSKLSADEKESNIEKDIIVSTIKSCGTGKDIVGLRAVICAEPIASKVIAAQVFGRIRPYAEDKDTFFFDICDVSIPAINWWWRSRYKKISSLCKETIFLDVK